MISLALATALVFPVTIVYLTTMGMAGAGQFIHARLRLQLLLAAAEAITVVPLLLFAAAARRIPLSMPGLIQYVAPTRQVLTGVLIYGEPFGRRARSATARSGWRSRSTRSKDYAARWSRRGRPAWQSEGLRATIHGLYEASMTAR